MARPLALIDKKVVASSIFWSIIIPTYRRQDVLEQCLARILASDLPLDHSEILVYDNGFPDTSDRIIQKFSESLPIRYTINSPGHGFGYSILRGARESSGELIVELNDDALIPPSFFERLNSTFEADPKIGIVGVRAIERGYDASGSDIGVIDVVNCDVLGNFCLATDAPIDVEHVYGFCYGYRRNLLESGGNHDSILLSRDFSNGNRIETDQCLSARRVGYRVVYDGRIAVEHLAKPRTDIDEKSLRWRLNYTRNTLYLFLKHFGCFGRRGIAIRFLLKNLGIRSALLRPNRESVQFLWNGMIARSAAFYHWFRFLGHDQFFGRRLSKKDISP